MSAPKLLIGGKDYAPFIAELSISRNDLDSDGSGRNILNGLMYRTRIVSKMKITVKLIPLQAKDLFDIQQAVSGEYTEVTYLSPTVDPTVEVETESEYYSTDEFYCSSFNFGNQTYSTDGNTYYTGGGFDLTER